MNEEARVYINKLLEQNKDNFEKLVLGQCNCRERLFNGHEIPCVACSSMILNIAEIAQKED